MLYDQVNRTAPISVPKRDKSGNIVEDVPSMDSVTTLFGISCNRQINSADLKERPANVTRSTVHKSVVVIARKPIFGPIRDKLAVITRAFFQQADFSDLSLIDNLYDNLNSMFSAKLDENTMYVGMSLRELIYRLRSNVLILLKALLLEKKIIFYSKNTEVLCASQFSLVSLVPALMDHLEDCCSPLLHNFESHVKKPLSLRSSDRKSLLTYMGLPLQPFAKGGMFNPYVPLQQIDELKAPETKYFLVGSTNTLLIESSLADLVVHMDNDSVEICTSTLKNSLSLSPSDKKWMDSVVSSVVDTWDPEDPWRPKGLGFQGSEDFVRQQFEDYIMGLISSVKYDTFLSRFGNSPPKAMMLREVEGNPIKLYNMNWVNEWRTTNNYRIFSGITDDEIFDIVEPKHMVTTISPPKSHQRDVSAASLGSHKSDEKDKTGQAPAHRPRSRLGKAWGNFWWGSQDQNQPQAQPAPGSPSSTSSMKQEEHLTTPGTNRNRSLTVSTHRSVNTLEPVLSGGSPDSLSGKSEKSARSQQSQKNGILNGWSIWSARARPSSSTGLQKGDSLASTPISSPATATTNPFSPAYSGNRIG